MSSTSVKCSISDVALFLQEDGITINLCAYECYARSLVPLAWASIAFLYLVVLQVAAVGLTIATWKVDIKVLNDSREMVAIIYTTSLVLLVLIVSTWAINKYDVAFEVTFGGGVMFATTVFLSLVFVPKVSWKEVFTLFEMHCKL